MAIDKINNLLDPLIGSGPLFPIIITTNDKGEKGWFPVKGDTKLIENNLTSLLIHQLGQRFRQENFGTRLWEAIEEGNTQAQAFVIHNFLKSAFAQWESRIVYERAEVTRENSKLNIRFYYHLNSQNSSIMGDITYEISK